MTQSIEFIKTPLYTANKRAYKERWPVICNEGGSRCFAPETLVCTTDGETPIKDIQPGQTVLTPMGNKAVTAVHEMPNTKKSVRVKLKSGHIIECTEDHKFFFNGGWHELKNILSLWDEKNTGV